MFRLFFVYERAMCSMGKYHVKLIFIIVIKCFSNEQLSNLYFVHKCVNKLLFGFYSIFFNVTHKIYSQSIKLTLFPDQHVKKIKNFHFIDLHKN